MMADLKVPLTKIYVQGEEQANIDQVLQSGWITQGLFVTKLEDVVARYLGAAHAVACSSCTSALHVALLSLDIGPGDEVIVPSYTWIATANVVRMVGAVPVFADIDPATFNITPETIEEVITPKTKVVMPVHQFGLPADIDAITALASGRNLIVIEDAACALGSRYKGRPVGSPGNMACFSFHPRKLITTGEGGMLLTDDPQIVQRARVLINHGASIPDSAKHVAGTVEALLAEEFHEVGYNYRMTNLQGAVGIAQMKALDEILALRRRRGEQYTKAFSKLQFLVTPSVPGYAEPNWQSYALRVHEKSPVDRNTLAQAMLDAGIACRPAYMACHVQPVYRAMYHDLVLPGTEKALRQVIILPLYPHMTDAEFDYVVATVAHVLAQV